MGMVDRYLGYDLNVMTPVSFCAIIGEILWFNNKDQICKGEDLC